MAAQFARRLRRLIRSPETRSPPQRGQQPAFGTVVSFTGNAQKIAEATLSPAGSTRFRRRSIRRAPSLSRRGLPSSATTRIFATPICRLGICRSSARSFLRGCCALPTPDRRARTSASAASSTRPSSAPAPPRRTPISGDPSDLLSRTSPTSSRAARPLPRAAGQS